MREKEEREWVEKKGRKHEDNRKGYVHRLDQVATSFFFTNFPDEIKAVDLWPKFAHFGRVGEVYIPDRLDKQGRRFGFVKYRDVRDAQEQLRLLTDIWCGTYKLRVNLARFLKSAPAKKGSDEVKGKGKNLPTTNRGGKAIAVEGKSFSEALLEGQMGASGGVLSKEDRSGADDGGGEVTWEVEVENEAVARLKGAYVGFLTQTRDHLLIQRNFIMDGYQHIKITPLGHLKVLISSSVEGEVKELVGCVGWWCNWFDKFEEWSPMLTSNQRVVWLNCFGVPLHAWGEAIFRTLGFKFGTFIEIDEDTKIMARGDVARIKIATQSCKMIDSTLSVSVLGDKFGIRVMEEVGALRVEEVRCCVGCHKEEEVRSSQNSGDGDSVVAVVDGESDEGDDSDWSGSRQVALDSDALQAQKGEVNVLRLEGDQGTTVSGGDPSNCGNSLVNETHRVNVYPTDKEDVVLEGSRPLLMLTGGTDGMVECAHVEEEVSKKRSSRASPRSGVVCVGPTNVSQDVGVGPLIFKPSFLRTKAGDLPFESVGGGGSSNAQNVEVVGQPISISTGPIHCVRESQLPNVIPSSFPDGGKGGRIKKAMKKLRSYHPYLPGSKNHLLHELSKGGQKNRRKCGVRVSSKNARPNSADSDPIVSSEAESIGGNTVHTSGMEEIHLEVVLPCPEATSTDVEIRHSSVRVSGNSGLDGLMNGDLITDWLVNKERGDAQHVIDIQEDLGVTFRGEGDEDVERCMRLEQRDHRLKNEWEQTNGYQ
jgi:hypothetical protein